MDGRRVARRVAVGLLVLLAACRPSTGPDQADSDLPSRSASSSPAATSPPDASAQTTGGSGTLDRSWPDETTTGVPDGTRLRPWDGDCTITRPGTRIDARLVECDLRIRTTDVVITRSRILGMIEVRQPEDGYSFTVADSEVIVGDRLVTAIGNGNFAVSRVEVSGGRRSIYCEFDCTIENSWVHAQAGDTEEGSAHLSGVRMGRNTTVRFNTIVCEGTRVPPASGCSAALTGYGDFAPIENNLVEGNYFGSGTASFCAFGGSTREKPFSADANRVRFIDNVFERGESGRCGIHGAIEGFDVAAPGNVWRNNVYDDGEIVPPD